MNFNYNFFLSILMLLSLGTINSECLQNKCNPRQKSGCSGNSGNLNDCTQNCIYNRIACGYACIAASKCASDSCPINHVLTDCVEKCPDIQKIRDCIDNCNRLRGECQSCCINNKCLNPNVDCPTCSMDF